MKFQFTENHEHSRFFYSVRQKIEDPGPIKLRTIFPHSSVLSKPPQLQYWVNKSSFSWKPNFPRFVNKCLGSSNRSLRPDHKRFSKEGSVGAARAKCSTCSVVAQWQKYSRNGTRCEPGKSLVFMQHLFF